MDAPGLWLVALVFASLLGGLGGLGGTLVGDLPQVEKQLTLDDFMDAPASTALRNAIKHAESAGRQASAALEQAQLKRRIAQADTAAARETFSNWLSTCRATELSKQNPELLARTRAGRPEGQRARSGRGGRSPAAGRARCQASKRASKPHAG